MRRQDSWGTGYKYVSSLYQRQNNGEGVSIPNFSDLLESVELVSLIGYDIPDFTARKNAGELLPCTPFDRLGYSGSATGTWRWDWPENNYPYQWERCNGNYISKKMGWVPSLGTMTDYLSDHGDALVQSAAASIMGKSQDALTFVYEFGKTMNMVRTVGLRMRRLIEDPDLCKIRDAWLEGRYGWRPLVYDLIGFHEAVGRVLECRTRWTQMVGLQETNSRMVYADEGLDYIGAKCEESYTYFDSWHCSYRGFVAADIELPAFRINPTLTAWEIIPYSFVVDWFVGVSTALNAIEFSMRNTGYVASNGHLLTISRTGERDPITSWRAPGWEKAVPSITATSQCTCSWSHRQPRRLSIIPQLKTPSSWSQAIDTLALVTQGLPCRKKGRKGGMKALERTPKNLTPEQKRAVLSLFPDRVL